MNNSKIKVFTKVIPDTPMKVQCTLVIDNEEPQVFTDKDKFNTELKRRGIDLTKIQYYHDRSE